MQDLTSPRASKSRAAAGESWGVGAGEKPVAPWACTPTPCRALVSLHDPRGQHPPHHSPVMPACPGWSSAGIRPPPKAAQWLQVRKLPSQELAPHPAYGPQCGVGRGGEGQETALGLGRCLGWARVETNQALALAPARPGAWGGRGAKDPGIAAPRHPYPGLDRSQTAWEVEAGGTQLQKCMPVGAAGRSHTCASTHRSTRRGLCPHSRSSRPRTLLAWTMWTDTPWPP